MPRCTKPCPAQGSDLTSSPWEKTSTIFPKVKLHVKVLNLTMTWILQNWTMCCRRNFNLNFRRWEEWISTAFSTSTWAPRVATRRLWARWWRTTGRLSWRTTPTWRSFTVILDIKSIKCCSNAPGKENPVVSRILLARLPTLVRPFSWHSSCLLPYAQEVSINCFTWQS